MFKFMNFLVRKPGMTTAEFRDYYEKSHVPLALRTFPQIIEHRRNYPSNGGAIFPDGIEQPWDAIVEIFMESRQGFDDMLAVLSDQEASKEIVADGDKFLNGPKCGMLIVDEVIARRRGKI